MPRAVSVRITGRVQGVWFRASTKSIADQLSLNGFVRNEPDGAVYAEVSGDPAAIREFITWCHRGPELARVTEVVVTDIKDLGIQGFEVRR
jgi:acylphosphatase